MEHLNGITEENILWRPGGGSCCCVDNGDRCSLSQISLFPPGHFKDSHKCSLRQLCTLKCQHWLLCGLNRCISRLLGELHLKLPNYKHFYFQPVCPQVSLQMKIHQNSGSGEKVTKHLSNLSKTVYEGLAQIYQLAYIEHRFAVYKLMLKQCRNAQSSNTYIVLKCILKYKLNRSLRIYT